MGQIQNIPFDQLSKGMVAESKRVCTTDDFLVFAHATGNLNPVPLGDNKASEPAAPDAWFGALILAVLSRQLPGPGTVFKSQHLTFLDTATAGEELLIRVELTEIGPDRQTRFATSITRADGVKLVEGEVEVIAPKQVLSVDEADMPKVLTERHRHFDQLLADVAEVNPVPTAVVVPEDPNSLGGAVLAATHHLITPILIGNPAQIKEVAKEIGVDVSGFEIVEAGSDSEAAAMGVKMVRDGQAQALMKGHLHTDVLLSAVVHRDTGLRTGKRLSHVFLMDVPGLERPLVVTDAAINIAPDLETKVDIIQNAVDLLHAIGFEKPKVGILSAVETINPNIPSTLDAAILSKMAERGQIKGAIVDGPLAMDNAIDAEAARSKGIVSMVAGQVDVLVAPNLDAGNMVAKELTYVAHAEAAGLVVGAKCPIILTSRADSDKSRLASCAVAALAVQHHKAK